MARPYSLPICALHSSRSSGPATWKIRALIGFLSVRLSLVGFTTASVHSIAMSPFLRGTNIVDSLAGQTRPRKGRESGDSAKLVQCGVTSSALA